jgi:L-malate glycosyltransferase
MRRGRVLIVQELLPDYRIPFFEGLYKRLGTVGIDVVAASIASRDAAWHRQATLRTHSLGRRSVTWHQQLPALDAFDLVITEQANRHLSLYRLLFRRLHSRTQRLALWGHGANLQANPGPLTDVLEAVKRGYSRLPDWWFAYTEGSAERVRRLGFPGERITVVGNAVDTTPHMAAIEAGPTRVPDQVAFIGTLHKDKRLDYLMQAADAIHDHRPGFRLLVAGDGPELARLQAVYWPREHVVFLGRTSAEQNADLLAASQLLLMPGLVGLVAVESLAAGCPIVTTGEALHSPEFEYLRDGANCRVVPPGASPRDYAGAVEALMSSPLRLDDFRRTCLEDAKHHTLDAMIDAFAAGVMSCLSEPRRGSSVVETDATTHDAPRSRSAPPSPQA